MDESAREEHIIHPVDRDEATMHHKVQGELEVLGHGMETKPPAEKPIGLTGALKQIGADVTHITGSTFDELMTGEGGSTRDRVASRNPISLAWERLKRKRSTRKQAA